MSKYLGVLATVTEEGIIQVPLDMLQTAGIKPNTKVELFSDSSNLFIRTAEKFCSICGVNTNTMNIGNQEICRDCLDRITRAAQEKPEEPKKPEEPEKPKEPEQQEDQNKGVVDIVEEPAAEEVKE